MSWLYSLIPKDRYITREELVRLTGWSDRKVGYEINLLRKNPETVIISSSHGKGYKRPAGREELELCIAECKSRISEESEKVRVMEKALSFLGMEEISGQMTFGF